MSGIRATVGEDRIVEMTVEDANCLIPAGCALLTYSRCNWIRLTWRYGRLVSPRNAGRRAGALKPLHRVSTEPTQLVSI